MKYVLFIRKKKERNGRSVFGHLRLTCSAKLILDFLVFRIPILCKYHASALQGKNAMNRQNVSLLEGNKELNHEKESFLRNKDFAESQIGALTKSLETMQKEIKDKESLVFSPHYTLEVLPNFALNS